MNELMSVMIQNIFFLSAGTGVEPLKKDLQMLWTSFLESVSSNMKDYLSLEHLGIILHHLSLQGKFKSLHSKSNLVGTSKSVRGHAYKWLLFSLLTACGAFFPVLGFQIPLLLKKCKPIFVTYFGSSLKRGHI